MKRLLIISLSMNALGLVGFIGKRYYFAHSAGLQKTEAPFWDQWNTMRTSLYNDMSINVNDIVFVGNSLTEGFPVTEIFGSHVKNRGIASNRTRHILQRIRNITTGHPKKLFIECGINDLRDHITVDSIRKNYLEIINTIKTTSPSTIIYIQSLFPTNKDQSYVNKDVVILNAWLNEYCQSNGIVYIDVYSALSDKGLLNLGYTEDGLHLNGKGYKQWQAVVSKYIN